MALTGGCAIVENSPASYSLVWNTGEVLDVSDGGPNLDLTSDLSSLDIPAETRGLLSSNRDAGGWRLPAATFTVPEPGAWALFILGFSALSAALRQRRSATGRVVPTPGASRRRISPA